MKLLMLLLTIMLFALAALEFSALGADAVGVASLPSLGQSGAPHGVGGHRTVGAGRTPGAARAYQANLTLVGAETVPATPPPASTATPAATATATLYAATVLPTPQATQTSSATGTLTPTTTGGISGKISASDGSPIAGAFVLAFRGFCADCVLMLLQ